MSDPAEKERVVHIHVKEPAPKGHGMSIFTELLDWSASAFICMLLLRVYFQYANVTFYHPLGSWILKITSPVLSHARRAVPHNWNWYGIDWTPLFIAFAFYWLWHALMFGFERGTLTGYAWSPIEWFASLPNAFFGLLHAFAGMLFWMVLIHIILSWFTPLPIDWLDQVVRPWLAPFRKLIPPLQGIDFSPMVLIICIKIIMHILDDMMPVSPPRGLHAILGYSPF